MATAQWDEMGNMTLPALAAKINAEREHANLSSAIRTFVLRFYRNQLTVHQGRPEHMVA